MTSDKKFGMLRSLLKAIGLSEQAADDAVNFIVDLLAGDSKDANAKALAAQFPYLLRDNFLSPAELHFYNSLRDAVAGRAVLCSKVSLGDLFYVRKGDDASRYRIYTNKIDRKHVDFLLCDPVTMQPLVGVELDDKSHQRPDRQTRDAFVDNVFKAAKLPLLHIPARRDYVVAEIAAQLAPYWGGAPAKIVQPLAAKLAAVPTQAAPKSTTVAETSPRCPKCGSEMILRTAKSGANAGNKFWGCSGYPNCRSMKAYSEI